MLIQEIKYNHKRRSTKTRKAVSEGKKKKKHKTRAMNRKQSQI